MKKILFCADMNSPFIQADAKTLGKLADVTIVNIPGTKEKWKDFVRVCILEIPIKITGVNIYWTWWADVTALPGLLLSKLFRKKFVCVVGDFEISKDKEIGWGNQLKPIRGAISRFILRNADLLIAVSPPHARMIRNAEPNSAEIVLVLNSIPEEILNADLTNAVKEDLVVTVSGYRKDYDKRKGIDTFERAVNCLNFENKVIRNVPRVEYIALLKRAKVFCQLSSTEAFGISCAEAMALGCVPVVSDRGSLPWLIKDAGIAVPYGNVKETVAAIKKAMGMDNTKAISRGHEFTESKRERAIKNIVDQL